MANYTIELRFLDNPPFNEVFNFNYSYYMKGLVPDDVYEQKKDDFIEKKKTTYEFYATMFGIDYDTLITEIRNNNKGTPINKPK